MKRIFLLGLACFGFMITKAQDEKAKTHYTVSGGLLGAVNLSKFMITENNISNSKYESKAGFSAGGWVNFPVTPSFSIEPQLMYSSYRYLTSSTATLLLNDGKISYISLPVFMKIHPSEKVAITFGPQLDFLSSVKDNRNIAVEESFNKTSISIFGGLEVFPHGKVSIFARYIHGLSNMDERPSEVSTTKYKNQNIQLGLKFRLFGGKKSEPTYKATETTVITIPDSDGDGINDNEDKCPTVAGVAKYQGCPVPDSDGDGIDDEHDKCPNVAGLAKYDGCPIPDTDGDGINDEEDKCPTVAGLAKYNGCPAPDRDNDGINDDEDKCPDVAGIASNNGCPEVPANVTKSLQVASQGIAFGTSNAKLTTRSNVALDKVVAIMNENPTLHVRVEGHTDNAGDDDANMKLSQDRADAVKAYLVSKGISEDRITTEGFGETQPIAENTTATGRTKNRRIEIKIMY